MNRFLVLTAGLMLVGCTSPIMENVDSKVDPVSVGADEALSKLRKGRLAAEGEASPVFFVNKDWLPLEKVDVPHDPVMEAQLSRQITINRSFQSVSEVSAYITALTSIPVSLYVGKAAGAAAPMAAPASPASPSIPAIEQAALAEGGLDTVGGGSGSLINPEGSIVYTGNISGLMDLVSARYGLFWEWDGVGVVLFKTKSKTFRIAALPGDTSLSSSVATESGGSSSGSSSSSSTSGTQGNISSSSEMSASVEFAGMSVWSGIEKSIQTMLSESGKLAVTPATGTIVVEDTPPVLRRVESFVKEQNAALSRQVVINVRVLAVELTDQENYGINWGLVYESVGENLNVSLGSSFPADDAANNLTFSVLSGGPWGGSSAIINALSKQGKVSQITSASVVTLNNQLAPFQVGRKNAYLASSTTTVSGDTTSISLEAGQITTGFSMNVLPHILDDKRLMLQYSADLSSLLGLEEVTSGDSKIQTPEIDTRNFMQRVIMGTGDTLVVTGFEQFGSDGETQGVGDARNAMLGGGVDATNNHTKIVVLIQPVLTGRK